MANSHRNTASAEADATSPHGSVRSSSISKQHDERTPLLSGDAPQVEQGVIEDPHHLKPSQTWAPTHIAVLFMVFVAILTLADGLNVSPTKRLMESILCYEYYERHDPSKILLSRDQVRPGALGGVDELLCKIAPVQASVASLAGWQTFFDGFPALIMALPIGWAADNFGRKPVLIVGNISFVLKAVWIQVICWFWQTLPLKLIWLSSLHGLLSGTSTVFSAMAFLAFADVTSTANRAYLFMFFASSNMAFNFIGPLLTAPLMALDPWIPMFLSTISLTLSTALLLLAPETLGYIHPDEEPAPIATNPTDILAPPVLIPPVPRPSFPQNILDPLRAQSAFLLTDSRIPLLILPFAVTVISLAPTDLLLQYASTRYGITYAASTLYTGVFYGLRALALLTAIPAATHALSTLRVFHRWSGTLTRDLVLLRVSSVLAALGWLVISLAPGLGTYVAGMALLALGMGATSLARAFITCLVRKEDRGKLYTFISMVDTLGLMIAGPVMAWLWKKGLEMDGSGVLLGMPFWAQAGLFVVVAVGMFVITVKKGEEKFAPGAVVNEEGDRV